MKYMADDGAVFESEQACIEHERVQTAVEKVRAEVRHYLSMLEFKTEGARRRVETEITQWIEYDTKQNPARYGVVYDDYDRTSDVVEVRPVGVA